MAARWLPAAAAGGVWVMALFPGFTERTIQGDGTPIHVVTAGSGPPLLLIHGYPQSHVMWHAVAPRLAEDFTVVVPDLRGYGDSGKPAGDAEHVTYSKRTMARDNVAVMRALGFEQFAVAGHDRGARVAYRMALDHPERVTRVAVLDIVPIHTMFSNVDMAFAMGTYHWFFLAQPAPLPEKLIAGDPEYYLRSCLTRWAGADTFHPEAIAEYIRCFRDPATVHGSCEDYRAGATIDLRTDTEDYGKKLIEAPLLALWGAGRGRRPRWDHLEIWRQWARNVRGRGLECGHFLPEEAPDETFAELVQFFSGK